MFQRNTRNNNVNVPFENVNFFMLCSFKKKLIIRYSVNQNWFPEDWSGHQKDKKLREFLKGKLELGLPVAFRS